MDLPLVSDENLSKYIILTAKEIRRAYINELREGALAVSGYNYYQLNPDVERSDMEVFRNAAKAAYPDEGDYIYNVETKKGYLRAGQKDLEIE
jgi:hypothetical protein